MDVIQIAGGGGDFVEQKIVQQVGQTIYFWYLQLEEAKIITEQVIPPPTMGEQWLLKQFSLNHPVEHIQKPKLPKLYVRVETSTSYFIIHNQFVK